MFVLTFIGICVSPSYVFVKWIIAEFACQALLNCRRLEVLLPAFRGLCKSLEEHSSQWKQYFSVRTWDLYFTFCFHASAC